MGLSCVGFIDRSASDRFHLQSANLLRQQANSAPPDLEQLDGEIIDRLVELQFAPALLRALCDRSELPFTKRIVGRATALLMLGSVEGLRRFPRRPPRHRQCLERGPRANRAAGPDALTKKPHPGRKLSPAYEQNADSLGWIADKPPPLMFGAQGDQSPSAYFTKSLRPNFAPPLGCQSGS